MSIGERDQEYWAQRFEMLQVRGWGVGQAALPTLPEGGERYGWGIPRECSSRRVG